MQKRAKIVIKGTVQGVGFRPFIYKIATARNLSGFVLNDSRGVLVDVDIDENTLDDFIEQIKSERPKNAAIDSIEITAEESSVQRVGFEIQESENSSENCAIIPADKSICPECLKEIKDPKNRRYNYFFANCTDCGPRYTIIRNLPYDRENTSMDSFKMCPKCQKEYENPLDRRFHAEPNSCDVCGPKLTFHRVNGDILTMGEKAIDVCAKQIKRGAIVAIKGMGGFHLVCDASKNRTVAKLRQKKRRATKPFAVMFRSIHDILKCTTIATDEEQLILSQERPIVLLDKRKPHRLEKFCISSDGVAPNVNKIGVILPYTPLYVLLMELLKIPIVVTSANISGEPLITNSRELQEKLHGAYDYYLDYDREILNPCDDSVAYINNGKPRIIRRARGYAPANIRLAFNQERKVLALGAQQKSTIAIGFGDNSIISPHIGDLETLKSSEHFAKNIELLERVYDFTPEVIVCDKHPHYESTKWGEEYSKKSGIELLQVQHHYAHILSLMAENKIEERILGIAWDGTGYGDDGTIWGGEFLSADMKGYERVAHFDTFKLIGGEAAVKEPRRSALSLAIDIFGEALFEQKFGFLGSFAKEEVRTLYDMHQKGINAPLCSSVGRIFDAVAAICDLLYISTYEGEAGMAVEALYDKSIEDAYRFEIRDGIVYFKDAIKEMLFEENRVIGVSKFINMLANIVLYFGKNSGLRIGISGGVFQNKALCGRIATLFEKNDLELIEHSRVPANDGGISLGQIAYAKYHRQG